MVYFTAEELCMIEMLTYFNEASDDIYEAASIDAVNRITFSSENSKGKTVGEILSKFDANKIALLKSNDDIIDTNFFISAKEWGDVIDYIIHSSTLSSLRYTDCFEKGSIKLALCFTDDATPNEAVVAFLGTADREEWLDDVKAAKLSDSPCQEAALNYINSLPYSDITVTGHSKGGNKAMYCTVLSDKITRCVSLDGQGFSKDFITKYANRVSERAGLITNYSLSTDFVHILLEQLPGIDHFYCEGYGLDDPDEELGSFIAQNHSPNSFFKTDDNGIATERNWAGRNVPIFDITSENSQTTLLKNYVAYLLSSQNRNAYESLIDYVEALMGAILDETDVQETILGDLLQLGTLIGYTISFIDSNDLELDDARAILYSLGFDKCETASIIIEALTNKDYRFTDEPNNVPALITGLLGFLGGQLTDGEDDYLLKQIIWDTLGDKIDDYLDQYEFYYLWNTIESKYEEAQGNENNYFEMDNGVIQDCVKYMRTDEFHTLVKNDSKVDEIIADLEECIADGETLNKMPDALDELKSLLEKYGYRLSVSDDRSNYRVGLNKKSVVFLGKGDDTFFGGRYNDIIFGGDGIDTIAGGKGNDIIHGGKSNDYLYGNDGDDNIFGDDGDDAIEGGEGNDTIHGGSGKDTIHGNGGNDNLYGDYGKDAEEGDIIYGEDGRDNIYGSYNKDYLYGGDDDDYIEGRAGNDTIYGNEGADTIDGGSGTDYLYGAGGNDTYIFNKDIYGSSSNQGHADDHDYVNDSYGTNYVLFKNVPTDLKSFKEIISFERTGNSLLIKSKQTGASMQLTNYYSNDENFYFEIDGLSGTYILNEDMELEKKQGSGGGTFVGGPWDELRDDTSGTLPGDYDSAGQAQPPRDPLIIDLNNDGVHTTNVENGVYFDIDNNGFAEKTAWIDTVDGFLVYNRDEDNKITNGSELFSDQVILPSGKRSADGFEVLKTFDTNNDNVVNAKDAHFADLRVWIDKDHNGVTYFPVSDTEEELAKKELFTLAELGITSISTVSHSPEGEPEDAPNKELFADVMINGVKHNISEHWFEASTFDTQELHTEGVDDDLTSFGNLHSVTYALEHDTDGYLTNLVDTFKASEDYVEKRILTKKILYHISGADNIASNSRGSAIDARDLHVIETIMGVESFIGAGNSTNPNTNAAAILKKMYAKFEELYFNLLNRDSKAAYILDTVSVTVNENGQRVFNLEELSAVLGEQTDTNGEASDIICSICSYLKAYDNVYGTNFVSQFVNAHPESAETVARYNNAVVVIGSDGNDTVNGTSENEIIWSGDGNDTINASSGNDTIFGGSGNDKISAGAGNDIIYGEDGSDNINADAGDDIVYGGDGDDNINAGAGDDLIYGEEGNDTVSGDAGNDVIYGGNGNDTLSGGAGDDVLYGDKGDDILNGGEGNDALYGGEGSDSLSGGTGDDILYGGKGRDTYYINADHGNDVIYDSEGLSALIFGDEISADDYTLSVDINNGIVLTHIETGETISLPDFINVPENYDFVFDGDSKILGGGDSRQVIEGTDGDDTITAGDGFNIIRGGAGDDTITGGDNLNFIYGGEGNDTITGGNGTNIIRGEDGDDTITDGNGSSHLDGGNGNDVINAGGGNDVVLGGAGADKLYGEDGDDVIAGNDGNDEIYGGNGDDTVYADEGNDFVRGEDGNDSLFGGDGDDTLYGDDGDDYLEAGNGNDNLYGGAGNDVFVGGEGVNNMYGDDGDDVFHGSNGINNMYGGDGDDNFTGGELADLIMGGSGNDTMNGGNGNNRMFGEDGDDAIYGGNDDDYIEGGEGDDSLYGGNGINTIYGGDGNDIIYDGDNNSFLYGGDGDDQIRAGGGSDVLDGGAGNDFLQSDHGGDTYIFGIGYDIDTISASADLNTIVIHGYTADDMHNTRNRNNDLIIDFGEDTGDRLIVNGFFNFNSNRDFNFVFDDETVLEQHQIEAVNAPVYGTSDDDQLFAVDNSGWSIIAGDGNDKLNGGSGNDILDGGAGDDILNGGTGANTYVYGMGYDVDTIEASADSCTIVIHGYSAEDMNSVRENDNSLSISFGDETGDKLIVKSFYEDYLDRNYQFVFDDGTVLGKSDINAKAAPIIGTDGDDNIYATNGDDIIDGGAGNDTLAGSNGEDTYIFGKGYGQDSVNEWGSDHSFVVLKDINSDEITVSDQWGSNLLISVNDTEDVLTVSNFKWGQSTFTFSFADGAEGYVDKNTWELVLTKQPDTVEEEDIEQTFTEYLSNIYSDDIFGGDLTAENTVISDVNDSAIIGEESKDISDIANIQTMLLVENMSAFSNDSQISDGINIGDITADTSALDQLLINS